jgi:hypothetical protein
MKARVYRALLCSTLLASPALAQEGLSNKSYGLTIGASRFTLPEVQTGVASQGTGSFSPEAGTAGLRGSLGLSGGVALGSVGGYRAGVGMSAFLDIGNANSTAVDSFSGPGVVAIAGYATPGNTTLALVTASAPGSSTASANITHDTPSGGTQTTNISAAISNGISETAAKTSSGRDSFSFGAVSLQDAVQAAAAFGAVGTSQGGLFMGAGDLTGLQITTEISRNVVFTGADVTYALAASEADLAFQGYAGPSYRMLSQDLETTTTVDIAEANSSGVDLPQFAMIRDEDLDSHYLGGVVGLNVTKPLSDRITFSMGLEGGLYYTMDSLDGQESYAIGGAAPQKVNSNKDLRLAANGIAWSARLAPSVTFALAPNRQLTLGGTFDYLSRAATVSRAGAAATASNSYAGTDEGAMNYNGASTTSHALAFGPMWSFGPTVSLTGQF